ncbi:MAG: Twin-arginine translocation pathway signal [Hyphomicrobiales bacterium]|nr:MAG: Twin-arginine translocation pathway signal [Hyphomicrobiales bacterium]
MKKGNAYLLMSRRELLTRSLVIGGSLVIGAGFVSAPDAAWAMEAQHLKPKTLATLIQLARDIYPHDQIGDEFYVNAIKGYDSKDHVEAIEAGIEDLNKKAGGDYLGLGWEDQRVAVLRQVEDTAFFQMIRGGLVTGLYNQKPVWAIFGYEGESFSKGGYINRGFNDINWL